MMDIGQPEEKTLEHSGQVLNIAWASVLGLLGKWRDRIKTVRDNGQD